MTTLSDLRSTVRLRFEQASTTRLSDTRLDEAINAGLEELGERAEFDETYVVVPLKGGLNYYDLRGFIPDTAVRITGIWSPSNSWWLQYADQKTLGFAEWTEVGGDPRKWFIKGLFHLGIFPRPDATSANSNLIVYFTKTPKRLDEAWHTLPSMPPDFVDAIVEYALFDLLLQDKETGKAGLHLRAFMDTAKALRDFTKRRNERPRSTRIGRRS